MSDPTNGVVLIATGEAHVRPAPVAARTLRRHPGLEALDRVHPVANPHRRSGSARSLWKRIRGRS